MRTKQGFGPRMVLKFAAWVVACAISGVGLYAETTVTFEPLGDLPGGGFQGSAYDVSADGSVVVGEGDSWDGVQQWEGFRWENGIMTGLGELHAARAVSDDGSIIVGNNHDNGFHAFRLENGVMTGLGDLPGGDLASKAEAISGDGAVIVGYSRSALGTEGFRWEDGIMTGLGKSPKGGWFSPTAVSHDGSVIVGDDPASGVALRWEDGVMTELEKLPGDDYSEALGVSADGSIVVGCSIDSTGAEGWVVTPCLWENGTIMALENLPQQYGPTGRASEVSGDGRIVVGYSDQLVIWSKDNEWAPVTVRSILESHGIDVSGVVFVPTEGITLAISADGTTIVGRMEESGVDGTQAFRIRIADSTPLDPLIGGTPIEGLQDWFLSDWFGAYNTTGAPWIFHAQHGFIYRDPGSTNESMFVYDDTMVAWWYTNEDVYPFLYAFKPPADNAGTDIESEWLWCFEETKTPRSFGVVTGPRAGDFLFFGP